MYTIFTYTASYVVTESLMIEVVILMKCPFFNFCLNEIFQIIYICTLLFFQFLKKNFFWSVIC